MAHPVPAPHAATSFSFAIDLLLRLTQHPRQRGRDGPSIRRNGRLQLGQRIVRNRLITVKMLLGRAIRAKKITPIGKNQRNTGRFSPLTIERRRKRPSPRQPVLGPRIRPETHLRRSL